MPSYKMIFEKAAKEGIEALELVVRKSQEFSFSLFHNEIDSYNISSSYVLMARGIYNGKLGYASSEKLDSSTPDYLISHIKENAKLTTSEDKPFIFPGSKKYFKKNVYSKKLEALSKEEKIARAKKLDMRIREKCDKIQEVQTQYGETGEEIIMMNSYGLNLRSKTNYSYIYSSAIAVDEAGETKNGFALKIMQEPDDLDIEELSDKAIKKTLDQFGSKPCHSDKYKAVLSPDATGSLLAAFLSNLSSEQTQKHASLLEGKLGEKIASRKLTVTESPLQKNVFFRYFDDEGVATSNKTLIKNGVLKTYLYNLKTANKDNVESTGNGYKGHGGAIGISMVNVALKPGKLSEKELIEKCGNGIYINDLSGLHAGLNPQSGNFSLLAQGFLIEDGKLTQPVALITAAGNLFKVFNDIIDIGNNVELQMNSYQVPSILIKSLAISGE